MKELLPSLPAQLNDVLTSFYSFKPEIALTALFIMVMGIDLIIRKKQGNVVRVVACVGLLVVAVLSACQYTTSLGHSLVLFNNMLLLARPGVVLKVMVDVLAAALLLYFPWDKQFKAHPKGLADTYTIVVGSVLGLHLMLMAVNLLSIYLAVEMVSIASYLLAAYQSDKALSAEAGLKFVLFGMASSAVMLYGISLVYAFTGSIGLLNTGLVNELQHVSQPAMLLALMLIVAGIGFKLGMVPLHFWVPDVYQGASTPIMAYLSTLPKIGAFGLIINFLQPFVADKGWIAADVQHMLAALSIITMLVGNFAAVWQTNVKRMLAYSSIGHTGFALMAVLVFTQQGVSAMVFYLLMYAIANVGTLALATYFRNVAGAEEVTDYRGLGLRYPIASVCYVIFLISLTGLPITAGFNAKLLVFSSNYTRYTQGHDAWLLAAMVTGALTTVVSLFYYIKIPLNLFLRKQEKQSLTETNTGSLSAFCVVLAFLVLLFGIFPDMVGRFLNF